MPQPRPEINRHELRTRSLPELEALLLDIRRSAVRRHLDTREWAFVDRLRKRCAALRKEEVGL